MKKKVWITKYALTKGLFQRDAEIVNGVYASSRGLFTKSWVDTEEEARAAWEEARRQEVARLKKKIARLEAMPCKFAKVES